MKTKLKYHFHNPNSEKETIDYIYKLFVEANKNKVDSIIQKEIDKADNKQDDERYSV